MKKTVRLASLLAAAALLFIALSVPFAIAHEARHDCEGDNCPVCALIAVCAKAAEHMAYAAVLPLCVSFVLTALTVFGGKVSGRKGWDRTSNGIRLLN